MGLMDRDYMYENRNNDDKSKSNKKDEHKKIIYYQKPQKKDWLFKIIQYTIGILFIIYLITQPNVKEFLINFLSRIVYTLQ